MRSISAGKDRCVALLLEFERSGLTMSEFCRRREVGYSTMAAAFAEAERLSPKSS
jgi:hypothetical protein